MYARSLHIYGFRCFGKAVLELQYPGRTEPQLSSIDNVNLILGDNGGGKSSVLRALAIAALAPALLESGFVPYRLVRRPDAENAFLKIVASLDSFDLREAPGANHEIELLARIDRRNGRGNLDRLHLEKTPDSPIEQLIYDDHSHAFFVVGYGATRRTETGDYIESSSRRSRGLRYQRIASLFEDHVTLRPMQSWFERLKNKERVKEVVDILSAMLPDEVTFDGIFDDEERQYIFQYEGNPTPFSSLSDGFKAHIGWVTDLLGHLCDVCPPEFSLDRIPGIVLIDEIDLHLHPSWQRTVVPSMAAAFPNLQFVMTSHSPLVASTVEKANVFLTDTADDGTATIKQIEESVHGRSIEQLLLSSYFGLETTRPETIEDAASNLFQQAAKGDPEAALAYLEQLAAPTALADEVLPEVAAALKTPTRKSASKKGAAKRAKKNR